MKSNIAVDPSPPAHAPAEERAVSDSRESATRDPAPTEPLGQTVATVVSSSLQLILALIQLGLRLTLFTVSLANRAIPDVTTAPTPSSGPAVHQARDSAFQAATPPSQAVPTATRHEQRSPSPNRQPPSLQTAQSLSLQESAGIEIEATSRLATAPSSAYNSPTIIHPALPQFPPTPRNTPASSLSSSSPPPYQTAAAVSVTSAPAPSAAADDDHGLNLSELTLEDLAMDAAEYADVVGVPLAAAAVNIEEADLDDANSSGATAASSGTDVDEDDFVDDVATSSTFDDDEPMDGQHVRWGYRYEYEYSEGSESSIDEDEDDIHSTQRLTNGVAWYCDVPSTSNRWYAVIRGPRVGVYDDW